jgi:hypothetical protein
MLLRSMARTALEQDDADAALTVRTHVTGRQLGLAGALQHPLSC